MAKKKNTDTQANKDIGNLPPQIILINSKKYGYDYKRLTFGQVMSAESSLQLKIDRLNYLLDNPKVLEYSDIDDFVSLTGAILFVPIIEGKWQQFDSNNIDEMKRLIESSPLMNYDVIESAITDFFTKRGKRSIASEALRKNQAASLLLGKLQKVIGSIASKELTGSLTSQNSNADSPNDIQM